MSDSPQQQQQLKLENLEKRVASVEKLLKIMDSELNNKIRWIIKTVGISNGEPEEDEDEPESRPLWPRGRIVYRQVRRKPAIAMMSQPNRSRLMVPEVQMKYCDDDEDEDEDGQEQLEDGGGSGGAWQSSKAGNMDMEIDTEGVDDHDDGADDYYEDEESAGRSDPDPLAVELELVEQETENEDQAQAEDADDDGEATAAGNHDQNDAEDENEIGKQGQNPWRLGTDENEDEQDQDQDEEDDDLPVAHFMDVSQLRSSDTSMKRRPAPATGNLLRARIQSQRPTAPVTSKFRLTQEAAARGNSKPGNLAARAGSGSGSISRVIVPRNRYLMPSSIASRQALQQQKQLANIGTKLKTRPGVGTNAATVSGTGTTSDAKEKVYFCDRCPLTFTLSTRHAHYELHKQMDLGKRQRMDKSGGAGGSNSRSPVKNLKLKKTSPRSLLKPISSLSPPRRTRIRPRKCCPVCPKSYSRNQYLRNHLQEHADEFPYICKECFLLLHSEKELEVHCEGSDRCFISTYQS